MAFVGVMVLAHFRWAPELFVAVLAIPIAWSVWHLTYEKFTQNRVLLVVGPLLAMGAYWTLRKEIRTGSTSKSTRPDDPADGKQ